MSSRPRATTDLHPAEPTGSIRRISREEAAQRSRRITVTGYEVDLDLTTGPDRYGTTSRVRFNDDEPASGTFIELAAPVVQTIVLNGRALDPAAVFDGRRVRLDGLRARNELTVVASGAYSRTSEGLHRFVDPVDGEAYVYSQSFLYDAHRLFACFDQPDLKAPLRLTVRGPRGWTVIANAPGKEVSPGRWVFEPTLPIATYVSAVVAGPWHSVTAEHDGIPLGVHCRRSLAAHLEPDEILRLTSDFFDHFHGLFGLRYPFGKYDQVFAPEFNAGAMENVGCATFAERFIFRSRVTDTKREGRAKVIAHELAHMWLGNLVTMRWWDDLWLSESFADYVAHAAVAETTRFKDVWAGFCVRSKPPGYDEDQASTTHPVAGAAADSAAALQNFDAISYVKGASLLKQLDAWVGRETFQAALRAYLAEHRFASVTLADLLMSLDRAGHRSLDDWSAAWLQTAGPNTLRPEVRLAADGTYDAVAIVQTAMPEHPVLRPHRIAIGLYDRVGERLVRRHRLEIDVLGSRTEVSALAGSAVADVLLLNDGDLGWTKIRFEERSLRTILDDGIGRFDSLMTRALVWSAVRDMTRDGELPAGTFVRLVLHSLPSEPDVGLLEQTLVWAQVTIDRFGEASHRRRRLAALADAVLDLAHARDDAPDLQLAAGQAFVRAATRRRDVAVLRAWLAGRGLPPGLLVDRDLRWLIVNRLAVLGAISPRGIDREIAADGTFAGQVGGAEARASLPTAAAKAAAWRAVMDDDALSNHLIRATARGFWQDGQLDLGRPYLDRYFEAMPAIWRSRTLEVALAITRLMYPAVLVEPGTIERTDAALAGPDVAEGLRRALLERRHEVARALAARQRDATGGGASTRSRCDSRTRC